MSTQEPDLIFCLDDSSERIRVERRRQDEKWGEQNHSPEKWLLILMEEVGEVAKEILEGRAYQKSCLDELVQVAAVAKAAIECAIRNRWVRPNPQESPESKARPESRASKKPGSKRRARTSTRR